MTTALYPALCYAEILVRAILALRLHKSLTRGSSIAYFDVEPLVQAVGYTMFWS